MNADVAQMNAKTGTQSFAASLAMATNARTFSVYLRCICVHLRFHGFSPA
jgi:hypothetical protein